jgi:hypothetical protein
MHGVLITFHSAAPIDALEAPFTAYAEQLRSIPGLIVKVWIRDGQTVGGFHVFADRAAADRYLGSEMVAGLTSNDAFTDFAIERYEVLEALSLVTGTPSVQLAGAI